MIFSPPADDYVVLRWGRSAYFLNGALQILLIPIGFPVALLTPPITLTAGCLTALTFGLAGLVFTILWTPFALILLGTSWLYRNVVPLRPLVAVAGFPFAILGFVSASWIPAYGDIFARAHRLKMATWWPLSIELTDPTWPTDGTVRTGLPEEESRSLGYTKYGRRAHVLLAEGGVVAWCGVVCEHESPPRDPDEVQVCKACIAAEAAGLEPAGLEDIEDTGGVAEDVEDTGVAEEWLEEEPAEEGEPAYGYTAHGRRAHLLVMPGLGLAHCGVWTDRQAPQGEANEMPVCKACTAAERIEVASGDVEEGEGEMPDWKRKLMGLTGEDPL